MTAAQPKATQPRTAGDLCGDLHRLASALHVLLAYVSLANAGEWPADTLGNDVQLHLEGMAELGSRAAAELAQLLNDGDLADRELKPV
jgi:hypothetical protein